MCTLSPIIMVQWLYLKGNDPIGDTPIFDVNFHDFYDFFGESVARAPLTNRNWTEDCGGGDNR